MRIVHESEQRTPHGIITTTQSILCIYNTNQGYPGAASTQFHSQMNFACILLYKQMHHQIDKITGKQSNELYHHFE